VTPPSLLRSVPLFADLDADSLALVASAARRVKFPKGSVVFQEGDPGDYLLVVDKGKVKVVLLGEDGRETIVNLLEPPALLGEIALLDAAPRSATVVTVTASEFLQIARGPFLALIRKHPDLAVEIMARLAGSLRKATEHVRSLTMFELDECLLRALLIMALESGETSRVRMVVRPHPAVKDLALMCGCTREASSRALKALRKAGYVSDMPDGIAVEAKAIRKYLKGPIEHIGPARRPRPEPPR
jgi:CRP-like cAMP-binding protein